MTSLSPKISWNLCSSSFFSYFSFPSQIIFVYLHRSRNRSNLFGLLPARLVRERNARKPMPTREEAAGREPIYRKGVHLTLCTWLFGIWQFQTTCQGSKQQRRSWICNIWHLIANSHIWFLCNSRRIYISAWASALLVLTSRAMPEPRRVGRVTGRFPRSFCISVILFRNQFK